MRPLLAPVPAFGPVLRPVLGPVLGALVTFAVAACGSDAPIDAAAGATPAPPQCNTNPWSCERGTTCAPGTAANTFSCLPSTGGRPGDPCVSYLGQATCGDGLACWAAATAQDGVCVSFCADDHPCIGGGTCKTVIYPGGGQAKACVTEPRGDGGTVPIVTPDVDASVPSGDGGPVTLPPRGGGGGDGDGDGDAATPDVPDDAPGE